MIVFQITDSAYDKQYSIRLLFLSLSLLLNLDAKNFRHLQISDISFFASNVDFYETIFVFYLLAAQQYTSDDRACIPRDQDH